MNGVTLRRNGRRVVAALLVSLLAAGLVSDLQMAVVFSPLLVLAALIGADRRVEAAIVEFVHRLGSPPERAHATDRLLPILRIAPMRTASGFPQLGSRAPPRFVS
jgi:hypothetical protein